MKNKIIITIAAMFVLALVSAGPAIGSFVLNKVSFSQTDLRSPPTYNYTQGLTYECDGVVKSINRTEPDGEWDDNDLKFEIKKECRGVVTEIKKDNVYFKENEYGLKSFDEEALKSNVCSKEDKIYNEIIDKCEDVTSEVVEK